MDYVLGEGTALVECRGPDPRTVHRLERAGFHMRPSAETGRLQSDLRKVMSDAIVAGVFPGAVAMVIKGRKILFFEAFGHRVVKPDSAVEPMTCDTIFDMASVTKALVTTTLVLRLADEGLVRLDDPIRRFFPELGESLVGDTTIRHLLTHTSGLPGWRPVYLYAKGREEAVRFLGTLEPAARPGECFVYSDLGFMLLGLMLERLAGCTLDVVAEKHIFAPLQMEDTSIGHSVDARRVAPTEEGNLYEQGMIGAASRTFKRWRTGIIRDTVHDGNAFYVLDGVSGLAGLFSSALDIAILIRALLTNGVEGESKVAAGLGRASLPQHYAVRVTEDHTGHIPGIHRGLGYDLNRGFNVLFGPSLGARAFGHTGFTGTSVVVDPGGISRAYSSTDHDIGLPSGPPSSRDLEEAAVYILLSNRVHPSAHNFDILTFRARYHEWASRLVVEDARRTTQRVRGRTEQ